MGKHHDEKKMIVLLTLLLLTPALLTPALLTPALLTPALLTPALLTPVLLTLVLLMPVLLTTVLLTLCSRKPDLEEAWSLLQWVFWLIHFFFLFLNLFSSNDHQKHFLHCPSCSLFSNIFTDCQNEIKVWKRNDSTQSGWYINIYLSIYPSIHPSISIYLSIYLTKKIIKYNNIYNIKE